MKRLLFVPSALCTDRTAELAVMCDTFKPLWLTTIADTIEQKDYHTAWVQTESAVHK